ncbi:CBN-FPN-1.2 protein, partial [Aphelenchoides avenae]
PGSTFACLYGGYTLSCLRDRIWAFAIIFVLQSLGGVQLVTINQLFQGVSGTLLSGYFGSWLDRHNRQFGKMIMSVSCFGLRLRGRTWSLRFTLTARYRPISSTAPKA